MIHACPKRMWYVEGYLVPKLVEQGIPKKSIVVWNDETGKGNLISCMEAFKWCGENPVKDGTWHLQDDALPSADFAKAAKAAEKETGGVICGFQIKYIARGGRGRCRNYTQYGLVPVTKSGWPSKWWSFQCVRIPDQIAGECAEWFYEEAVHAEEMRSRLESGKNDDWFFSVFLMRRHPEDTVLCLVPNVVEHIADLIGGSSLGHGVFRGAVFEDRGELAEVTEWIKARGNGI